LTIPAAAIWNSLNGIYFIGAKLTSIGLRKNAALQRIKFALNKNLRESTYSWLSQRIKLSRQPLPFPFMTQTVGLCQKSAVIEKGGNPSLMRISLFGSVE
jgi:hypothetical protein